MLIETFVELSLSKEDIVSVTIIPLDIGNAQLTQVLYVIQPEFDPNETDKFIIVTSGIIIENESVQTILDNNALKLAIETAITAAVSSVANKPPYEFTYEQNNDDVVITFKIELKNPDYVSASEQQILNQYMLSNVKIFRTELDSVKNYIEDFLKDKSSEIENTINENYDDSDGIPFSVNDNVIVEDDVVVVTENKTLESHAEDFSPKLKQATLGALESDGGLNLLEENLRAKGFVTSSASLETQGVSGSGDLDATITLQEKPSMLIPVNFKLFTLQRGFELQDNSTWLNQLRWRLHHDDDLYASISKSHTDINIIVTDEIRLASESESEESKDDSPDYDSMTVPELKELLKESGKPVSGKKAELISRLKE